MMLERRNPFVFWLELFSPEHDEYDGQEPVGDREFCRMLGMIVIALTVLTVLVGPFKVL